MPAGQQPRRTGGPPSPQRQDPAKVEERIKQSEAETAGQGAAPRCPPRPEEADSSPTIRDAWQTWLDAEKDKDAAPANIKTLAAAYRRAFDEFKKGSAGASQEITADNLGEVIAFLDRHLLGGRHFLQQAGRLVMVVKLAGEMESDGIKRKTGQLIAMDVVYSNVRTKATEVGLTFYKTTANGISKLDLPAEIGRTFVAHRQYEHAAPLVGISAVPQMRADGSFVTANGYDDQTSTWREMAPEICKAMSSVKALSREACAKRINALFAGRGLFCDFRFATDEDRAGFLAALLTPLVRDLCPQIPGVSIDAPKPGSGKTTLADMVGLIHVGDKLAAQAWPNARDDEEVRKMLFGIVKGGDQFVKFDNVKTHVDSGALAGILTAEKTAQRILGTQTNVAAAAKVMVIFTGNNITFSGELNRRFVHIRLDTQSDNPITRTFEHPDIFASVAKHRAKILQTLAGLLVSYRAARADEAPKGVSLAGYGPWCELVRDAILWIGWADAGRRSAEGTEDDGGESEAIRHTLEALHNTFSADRSFTAREVVQKFEWDESKHRHNDVQLAMTELCSPKEPSSTQVGHALRKCRDVRLPGLGLWLVKNKADNHGNSYVVKVSEKRAQQEEEKKKDWDDAKGKS